MDLSTAKTNTSLWSLPRISGGGPDISFDEWMKLEFPPRKRGSRAKHRPELLLRKAGSWACIGFLPKNEIHGPCICGGQEKCSNAVADKAAIAKRFSFFRPRS